MKFKLTKLTGYLKDKPLKDKRVKKIISEYWETRACSEEAFDKRFSETEGAWRSKGTDHQVINNGKWITRRLPDVKIWAIELNTLEELTQFILEVGEIVSMFYNLSNKIFEIEIR